MFDWNSSSSSVRNEGVTSEACACLSGQSLKRKSFQKKDRNEGEGGNNSTRAGHVIPSFRTDDEEEFQSNIDLVSLV